MRYRMTVSLLALALTLMLATQALAEKRVALVIGNDDYTTLPDLNNAKKDATDMARTLKGLGFDVILKTNAGRREMGRALVDFEGRLSGADAGLVFYAGHGIQADGTNWLIPSDARIEVEGDLPYESVDAADFLNRMRRAGAPVNLVILDACRDNPLPTRSRSASRGLAVQSAVQGVKGIAMLYSAGPGEKAADGPRGGNGVFTGELLKALTKPGLTVEQVFKETAKQVNLQTGGKQTPWINASLTGDFYFKEEQATASSVSPSGMTPEMMFWQSIQGSTNPADFEAYVRQFPNGTFAALAGNRIKDLKERQVASLPPTAAPSLAPTKDQIRDAQRLLAALSYKPGPADGIMGRGTRTAIQQFQRQVGLPGDGMVSDGLLDSLRKARPQVATARPAPVPARPTRPVKPAVGVYFRPGDTFRDCAECPEMVVIPAGRFRMGDLKGGSSGAVKPVHAVNIGYKFAVGKFEVTFSEWDICVSAGGCGLRPGDEGWGRGNRPVIKVNWDDAKAYVKWLSRRTGKRYRLLSEAEWEYMARAGSTTNYPWGNSVGNGRANCDGCGSRWDDKQTAPAGSFKANAFGVHDTVGNVWEWTEDCGHNSYSGAPANGKAWTTGGDCGRRVLRGGSWYSFPEDVRSANRNGYVSDIRYSNFGFRVSRDL